MGPHHVVDIYQNQFTTLNTCGESQQICSFQTMTMVKPLTNAFYKSIGEKRDKRLNSI